MTVSIVELKAKASEIVSRAEKGEHVTITRNGKPVAQLDSMIYAPEKALSLAEVNALLEASRVPGLHLSPDEIKELINEGRL